MVYTITAYHPSVWCMTKAPWSTNCVLIKMMSSDILFYWESTASPNLQKMKENQRKEIILELFMEIGKWERERERECTERLAKWTNPTGDWPFFDNSTFSTWNRWMYSIRIPEVIFALFSLWTNQGQFHISNLPKWSKQFLQVVFISIFWKISNKRYRYLKSNKPSKISHKLIRIYKGTYG